MNMSLVYDVDNFETIVVSNVAIGISADMVPRHNYAYITVETDQVRFRIDGANPTAAVGHLLEAGDTLELFGGHAIMGFRAIRVTADATLRVSLGYREKGMP